MYFGNLPRHAARACAVLAVAAALSGCSMIPDWMGGDSETSPPPDQSAQSTDAANAPYPDLADTPDRPKAPSTPDDQKQVASSLAADRSQQSYSADQLRAGDETAAAPPPAEAPHEEVAEVDTSSTHSAAPDSVKPSDDSGNAPDSAKPADDAGSAPDTSAASSNATPDSEATDSSSAAPAPASTVATTTTTTTSAVGPAPMSGPPTGPPAVPPVGSVTGMQPMSMSDAQLGFQPSKAPPLDSSVAQFVPEPIISRYRQTASVGGMSGVGGGAAVPSTSYNGPAIGGPEGMSGAVVANFDSLQGGASPVAYNPSGGPAAATVYFRNDTTILNAQAKAQVRAAAESFNAQGGNGYIRVVGHSSSRSANMSAARHLQWDFDHSQARANSVARALIAAGVPASKVLISAVGDDKQSDADTGRRADIFIQS